MAERALRKTRVGIVVSDKMDKTIVVAIRDNVKHPLYKMVFEIAVIQLFLQKVLLLWSL